MSAIEVGCAVVEKNGKVLIAQRKPGGAYGGFWEFPGGKRHAGESMEACLIRELREELGIGILPRRFLFLKQHRYPDKEVALYFYLCDWVSGSPSRLDCFDFRWVGLAGLRSFLFLPGDDQVLTEFISKPNDYFRR